MASATNLLADITIFSLLDELERETLSRLLESEQYRKGDTIYAYGDPGEKIYIIRSGLAEVWIENDEGQKLTVSEPCAGDVFGEISFLDGGPRTATACALEDTDCLTLTREHLLEFIDEHAHAAIDLLTVMGQRWRRTDALLRKHVVPNVNKLEDERLTFGQRIADKVASFGGSWTFIITFGVVILGWIGMNVTLLRAKPFDPYPFILLNLVLSCLAALQAPVIMMSQNRQSSKDRLQADADYETNLKAELEIAHLHKKVDKMYEIIQSAIVRNDRRDRDWGRMA